MKTLVIEEPGSAKLIQLEKPNPGPGFVLSKVIYSGICGTDISIYRGDEGVVKYGIHYPIRIGHEWSGIVEQVGENVRGFKPGDRVVSDNGVSCGQCEHCLKGEYGLCENARSLGTINCWDGSFAEYILMPEYHMHKLPDSISLDDAALIEPATIALAAVHKAEIKKDSNVLVIGTGAIGLAAASLCKYYGAKQVLVSGRKDAKLKIARMIGADGTVNVQKEDIAQFIRERCNGKGVDVIIETSGSLSALSQCIDITNSGAVIALVGYFEGLLDHFEIDKFINKKLELVGIMGEFGTVETIIDILGTGKVNLHPLITHRYIFDEVISAIQNVNQINDTKIKMMVSIDK